MFFIEYTLDKYVFIPTFNTWGKFICVYQQAANAILIAATEDEHSEVRHESLLAYQTHPSAIKSLFKRSER